MGFKNIMQDLIKIINFLDNHKYPHRIIGNRIWLQDYKGTAYVIYKENDDIPYQVDVYEYDIGTILGMVDFKEFKTQKDVIKYLKSVIDFKD